MKKILTQLTAALCLILTQVCIAAAGSVFDVSATGNPGAVNLNLCLDGKGVLPRAKTRMSPH
ncbi:Uncharacterised protein [Legionella steigerwaltii]|uniref:Uncharacterized protein n=1 Tax=Legionella steigerwaltii TaxID=460 RepID=A0A378LBD1_9GAMM|nr:hypothetical protein [Legionella steigerwaltii]KTD70300.1 hypothetical protein Lstg_3302 [Legionella steigerwaltii]STY24034.1 Uncharacterised protein [Legionella steigerwaltii]